MGSFLIFALPNESYDTIIFKIPFLNLYFGFSCNSGGSQYSASIPQNNASQHYISNQSGVLRSSGGSSQLRSSGSSVGSGVRDSRGSRGSNEGLRLSSGSGDAVLFYIISSEKSIRYG